MPLSTTTTTRRFDAHTSSPFNTASVHVAGWHLPLRHTPLLHVLPLSHDSPMLWFPCAKLTSLACTHSRDQGKAHKATTRSHVRVMIGSSWASTGVVCTLLDEEELGHSKSMRMTTAHAATIPSTCFRDMKLLRALEPSLDPAVGMVSMMMMVGAVVVFVKHKNIHNYHSIHSSDD